MNNDQLPPCDPDVFKHGESLGLFAMGKHEAERWCKAKSTETGDKYDWHYAGGRVHILCLPAVGSEDNDRS